jgi:glycosyltransferase involved in cell wall biosynthesis
LKRRAAALGLTERIQWLGYRADVPRLLNAADLFVFPSHIEGMSLALLEAMASAAAIVASDIPANAEVISEGTGLLVPVSDATALSAAIVEVLSAPEKGAKMGQAARTRAESHFAIEHFISAFETLFRETASV